MYTSVHCGCIVECNFPIYPRLASKAIDTILGRGSVIDIRCPMHIQTHEQMGAHVPSLFKDRYRTDCQKSKKIKNSPDENFLPLQFWHDFCIAQNWRKNCRFSKVRHFLLSMRYFLVEETTTPPPFSMKKYWRFPTHLQTQLDDTTAYLCSLMRKERWIGGTAIYGAVSKFMVMLTGYCTISDFTMF